jgi:hypothetical protein
MKPTVTYCSRCCDPQFSSKKLQGGGRTRGCVSQLFNYDQIRPVIGRVLSEIRHLVYNLVIINA